MIYLNFEADNGLRKRRLQALDLTSARGTGLEGIGSKLEDSDLALFDLGKDPTESKDLRKELPTVYQSSQSRN